MDSGIKPIVIIEHCEKDFSPWLILEYRHSSLIYGRDNVIFTRIPRRYHKIMLKYGRVYEESTIELLKENVIKPWELGVLDPKATETLTYSDLLTLKYITIGGILGDHPPKGRTYEYITSKMPSGVRSFNIGEGQYSIDGAVYYVHYLWINGSLQGFKYIDGARVDTEYGYVELPFRYPVVNGKPLLADGLEYYLKYRKIRDDIWLELTQ